MALDSPASTFRAWPGSVSHHILATHHNCAMRSMAWLQTCDTESNSKACDTPGSGQPPSNTDAYRSSTWITLCFLRMYHVRFPYRLIGTARCPSHACLPHLQSTFDGASALFQVSSACSSSTVHSKVDGPNSNVHTSRANREDHPLLVHNHNSTTRSGNALTWLTSYFSPFLLAAHPVPSRMNLGQEVSSGFMTDTRSSWPHINAWKSRTAEAART